jgi:hypothetical protein|tara:strand:- start:3395 stop:3814 length:420 start_codon:yes stop_codon:yes gene_type:complete
MAVYASDGDITDRISTNLTGSDIDDATKRSNKLILPATAIIDAYLVEQSPFADIAASPATPEVIHQACIMYCLAIANRVLANNSNDEQAKTWEALGDKILQVDSNNKAHLVLASVTTIALVDMTRDLNEERQDEQNVVQ